MKEELFKDYQKRLNALEEGIRDAVLNYAEELYLNQKCSKDEAIDRAIAKVEMEKRKLQSVTFEVDDTSIQPDVIIVGAGLSGLIAAYQLEQKGVHVIVLEAGSEVGGRTKTKIINKVIFDLGGQFVGKRHNRMRSLCKTLNLHLSIIKLRKPITWYVANKSHINYFPPLSFSDAFKGMFLFFKLTFMARNIDSEKPWQAKNAFLYDKFSFHTWLQKQKVSERLYDIIKGVIQGYAAKPVGDISLLHVLWWIARSGGIIKALRDGINMTVKEGTQNISQTLVGKLTGKVVFNAPVVSIEQDDEKVKVSTNTDTYTAKYAIVTSPIGTLKAIHFDPAMPEDLQEMINTVEASKASSVVALLKHNKKVFSDAVINHKIFPLAWRPEKLKLKGLTFVDLQEDVYAHALSSCFTSHQDSVNGWATENWGNNHYAQGTYIVFKPGQLTKYGPLLREPHGRVFFAGAERSSWANNMEGAVESGESVADTVSKFLIEEKEYRKSI
jgi:monoamine oxidase